MPVARRFPVRSAMYRSSFPSGPIRFAEIGDDVFRGSLSTVNGTPTIQSIQSEFYTGDKARMYDIEFRPALPGSGAKVGAYHSYDCRIGYWGIYSPRRPYRGGGASYGHRSCRC